MSFTAWMAVGGALLLTMALSSALIQRLPVSTAAIYLGVGCALGPWGFSVLRIDLSDSYCFSMKYFTWLSRSISWSCSALPTRNSSTALLQPGQGGSLYSSSNITPP